MLYKNKKWILIKKIFMPYKNKNEYNNTNDLCNIKIKNEY